ncbi:hypothetical protein QBC42DRAFT_268360 [Cladorrhinum samala]|uniref:Uncharacterized protein n=1 Tax=Cladorrhinum samala TaxID=585594 RepID=A0AAV9HN45_9PEZI|nr:hypothetical protein QBC42DRAFT_268360 [Cladorrhinum samala]
MLGCRPNGLIKVVMLMFSVICVFLSLCVCVFVYAGKWWSLDIGETSKRKGLYVMLQPYVFITCSIIIYVIVFDLRLLIVYVSLWGIYFKLMDYLHESFSRVGGMIDLSNPPFSYKISSR